MIAQPEREAWLAERMSYIGGSEAAAIVGLNRYKSALEVFLEKTGQGETREENMAMLIGVYLEPLGAYLYEKITGYELEPGRLVRHPEYPFLAGNPDRLIKGEKRGLEIKTYSYTTRDEWGPQNGENEEESDMVPEAYWIQAHWYLNLFQYDAWDVIGIDVSAREWRLYTIRPNDVAVKLIQDQCIKFWRQVEAYRAGKPYELPEPTGKECDVTYLRNSHPISDESQIVGNHQCDEWAATLKAVREELRPLEESEKDLKAKLMGFMGDSERLTTMEGEFTWKNNRPKVTVNWQNIAIGLLEAVDKDQAEALITLNTNTTLGSRVFRCPRDWKEE